MIEKEIVSELNIDKFAIKPVNLEDVKKMLWKFKFFD